MIRLTGPAPWTLRYDSIMGAVPTVKSFVVGVLLELGGSLHLVTQSNVNFWSNVQGRTFQIDFPFRKGVIMLAYRDVGDEWKVVSEKQIEAMPYVIFSMWGEFQFENKKSKASRLVNQIATYDDLKKRLIGDMNDPVIAKAMLKTRMKGMVTGYLISNSSVRKEIRDMKYGVIPTSRLAVAIQDEVSRQTRVASVPEEMTVFSSAGAPVDILATDTSYVIVSDGTVTVNALFVKPPTAHIEIDERVAKRFPFKFRVSLTRPIPVLPNNGKGIVWKYVDSVDDLLAPMRRPMWVSEEDHFLIRHTTHILVNGVTFNKRKTGYTRDIDVPGTLYTGLGMPLRDLPEKLRNVVLSTDDTPVIFIDYADPTIVGLPKDSDDLVTGTGTSTYICPVTTCVALRFNRTGNPDKRPTYNIYFPRMDVLIPLTAERGDITDIVHVALNVLDPPSIDDDRVTIQNGLYYAPKGWAGPHHTRPVTLRLIEGTGRVCKCSEPRRQKLGRALSKWKCTDVPSLLHTSEFGPEMAINAEKTYAEYEPYLRDVPVILLHCCDDKEHPSDFTPSMLGREVTHIVSSSGELWKQYNFRRYVSVTSEASDQIIIDIQEGWESPLFIVLGAKVRSSSSSFS